MKDNLAKLQKIRLISKVRRIQAKDLDFKDQPETFQKLVKFLDAKLFLYEFFYKSNGHDVIGYLVEPRKGKNLPCVIWNRGGSRDFGAIRYAQLFSQRSAEISTLAMEGYIVIASQYSGHSGIEGVDEFGGKDLDDVLNLQKILKDYSRADDSKIGMIGTSRGGLMTLLSLAKVKWIKAAIAISASTNEVTAAKYRKGWAEHQKKMFGGSMKEKIKRSPVYWPEKFSKKSPLLLIAGTGDWRVYPLNSINLAEKLFLEKVPYRLIVFEGADHGINEFRQFLNIQILDWFDRFLKKGEKLPNLKPHGN